MVNKTGLITGAIIAVLLISYHVFSMSLHNRQDFLSSMGGWLMIMAVLIGGALSGFIIENYIIQRLTHTGSIWGCIAGSVILSPLSMYLGIVFGTISGGVGEDLGSKISMGEVGHHLGIFVGIH